VPLTSSALLSFLTVIVPKSDYSVSYFIDIPEFPSKLPFGLRKR